MLSKDERDENGNLTDTALALDALENHGCDCGTDEKGTCLVCRCEKALRTERARAVRAEESSNGWKECMDMVRQDLQRHGVDLSKTPPYSTNDAMVQFISKIRQDAKRLEEENGRLQGEVFKFKP